MFQCDNKIINPTENEITIINHINEQANRIAQLEQVVSKLIQEKAQ